MYSKYYNARIPMKDTERGETDKHKKENRIS